jgi:hypothetical protein
MRQATSSPRELGPQQPQFWAWNSPWHSAISASTIRSRGWTFEQLFGWLREWVVAQFADQQQGIKPPIYGGKTLWGSAGQPDGTRSATRVVTQVTLYAKKLGVTIAQTSVDTGKSHEQPALKQRN